MNKLIEILASIDASEAIEFTSFTGSLAFTVKKLVDGKQFARTQIIDLDEIRYARFDLVSHELQNVIEHVRHAADVQTEPKETE